MKSVVKKAVPRADLSVKIVDDGVLILDKNSEKIHQLNETAGFVWDCLTDGKNTDEIAAEIARKFDVSKDIAVRDTDEIFHQFGALGLLLTAGQE